MAHLNETQLLDALDGRIDPAAAAHLAVCRDCNDRVDELRSVIETIGPAEQNNVPEPSPLFWEQFPARVSRAIDAQPKSAGWWTVWHWWGSAVTAAVVLLILVLPLRREAAAPHGIPQADDAAAIGAADVLAAPENLDDDEAWAIVRAVAEEAGYEEVQESGVRPRAESIERAALELSDDERAELARLIEHDTDQIKQRLIRHQKTGAGASTP